jgi:hypothetical protein
MRAFFKSLALALPLALMAQPTVTPTPVTVGRARGEDVSGFNVVHSFETGYRLHSVSGNASRYRSDVNYGNGIRLLSSGLTVNSKEGHGHWFDELLLNTQGLGNDPYQFVSARLQRNRLYRYEFTLRINDYLNPGLTTGTLGGGAPLGHLRNTRRQMQDHDFTLLPAANVQLLAGYSRNSQDGPGLNSTQLFDSRGDEFPLFAGIDRRQSEFRVGGQFDIGGLKLLILRGWERYRETMSDRIDTPSPGAIRDDLNTVTSFRRGEPYTGETPFWRFHLIHDRRDWYAVNARFHYAGGRRAFTFDEVAIGTDRRGADRNRQIRVGGSGRRPVSTGSATFSLFPTRKLTLTNHTAFHQVVMDGDGSYAEFNDSTAGLALLRFQYLGIRTVANTSEANLRLVRWLGLYGGYHYSQRRIRSREGERIEGTTEVFAFEQSNNLRAGLAGVRLQPTKPLTVSLDGEIGRAERPFFPLSERNYNTLGGRVQYRAKTLTLVAASRAQYNTNSASLFAHSARARSHSASASWTPSRQFALDAGYDKLHFDSLTGLAYFALGREVTADRSVYTSNIHAVNFGIRLSPNSRADVYVGYSRVQDRGDGRSVGSQPPARLSSASTLEAFRIAQVFPLAYDSPQARLSLRLHNKLRWNAGYQLYRYAEKFVSTQDYRGHTGFTSLTWSF